MSYVVEPRIRSQIVSKVVAAVEENTERVRVAGGNELDAGAPVMIACVVTAAVDEYAHAHPFPREGEHALRADVAQAVHARFANEHMRFGLAVQAQIAAVNLRNAETISQAVEEVFQGLSNGWNFMLQCFRT